MAIHPDVAALSKNGGLRVDSGGSQASLQFASDLALFDGWLSRLTSFLSFAGGRVIRRLSG